MTLSSQLTRCRCQGLERGLTPTEFSRYYSARTGQTVSGPACKILVVPYATSGVCGEKVPILEERDCNDVIRKRVFGRVSVKPFPFICA